VRVTQVKSLATWEAFTDHLDRLGVPIPVDQDIDPSGPLAEPLVVHDGSAGELHVPNRFAALPMEGWDGTEDGRPTELVRRRWSRIGSGGCGLVWGEATAVRADGRANPRQLVLDERTVDDVAGLRSLLAADQVAGLQLTHSGRFARPDGTPQPRTAYPHPILDDRVGATTADVLGDDDLDELAHRFVDAAVLAAEAGFDFVDVKHCHGYLLHELLSARERPGPYGGDLAGRTRFLRTVVAGIRDRAPGLAVAVRLSLFDLVPHAAGPDGTGEPVATGPYPFAFGGDGTGVGADLTEAHAFLALLESMGIGLVGTTLGSPYYCPHLQRPAYFPPSDGYAPPEDPLVGVGRHLQATAEVVRAHPGLVVVGAGYTYLQDWLPHVAQAVVGAGDVHLVGLGRMLLSYPDLAASVLAGEGLRRRQVCRTFSDCTTAPRHGLVSGCYPLDPFYKEHPDRPALFAVKAAQRRRDRP
jgi:NADPH2 dehydrogenase